MMLRFAIQAIFIARGAPIELVRQGHVAVFDNGKIWVHGGHSPENLLDDLTHYDVQTETWSQVQISNGSRPVARMSHVAVYENGHIWLHGGYGGGLGELRELNDLWRFDLDTKTWEEFPKIDVSNKPSPRQMHVAVLVDGHIYVHGGSQLGASTGDLWCFNITTFSWTQQQQYNSPPPRHNHVTVGEPGKLWVHGGRGGWNGTTELMDDLWSYDIDTKTWMQTSGQLKPKPPPREMHVAVLADGFIWLHGGLRMMNEYFKFYGGEWLADLWCFDLSATKWIKKADFPWETLPMINPVAIVSTSHMWIHGGINDEIMQLWSYELKAEWKLENTTGEEFICAGVFLFLASVGVLINGYIFWEKMYSKVRPKYAEFASSLLMHMDQSSVGVTFLLLPFIAITLLCVTFATRKCYNRRILQPLKAKCLADPRGLALFLVDCDIRLIRVEYLRELIRTKKSLPRRQEAEAEELSDALITHSEVLAWAHRMSKEKGSKQRILAISHSWESKQHPDPWSFQLEFMMEEIEKVSEHVFGVFFDYTSLYQYKRSPQEEKSYKKAMAEVYTLYAHEFTYTLCINKLTPKQRRMDGMHGQVMAYYEDDNGKSEVQLVQIKDLDKSVGKRKYLKRGWCISELQWSGLRDIKEDKEVPEFGQMNPEGQKLWKRLAPVPHELLRKKLSTQEVKFTHREDMELVIKAQKAAFSSKVEQSDKLHLNELNSEQLDIFGDAVHHYPKLTTLEICKSSLATPPGEEPGESESEKSGDSEGSQYSDGAEKLLCRLNLVSFMRRLNSNKCLRRVCLQKCDIGDREVKVLLTEAIEVTSNMWQTLDLDYNNIQNPGAMAFAKSISKGKCRLEELLLARNEIEYDGAFELAKAWKENLLRSKSLKSKKWKQRLRLDLSENEIQCPEKIPIPHGVKDDFKLNDQRHCL